MLDDVKKQKHEARIERRKKKNDTIKFERIKPNEALGNTLTVSVLIAYTVLVFAGIFLLWDAILLEVGDLKFNWGLPITLIPIIHFLLSLKRVETSQIAGTYFYGKPLKTVGAGLNFVPVGIMELVSYPADPQEILEPGSREEIFWGDEKIDLPEGKVRPIWLPTRSPADMDDLGKRPMDAQMVVGVAYHVFYRIRDVFTFHAYVGSVGEADKQLKMISVRALGEIIVEYTAGEAVEEQAEINGQLDDLIREDTSHWGIEVSNAGLEQINLSHELGAAMRDRAKAKFEAETKQIETDAEAYQRIHLGDADGKAARSREAGPILGRVDGLKTMMNELKVDGSEALASETGPRMMEKADVLIAGAQGGLTDILAGAKSIQTALKMEKKPKQEKEGEQ